MSDKKEPFDITSYIAHLEQGAELLREMANNEPENASEWPRFAKWLDADMKRKATE